MGGGCLLSSDLGATLAHSDPHDGPVWMVLSGQHDEASTHVVGTEHLRGMAGGG